MSDLENRVDRMLRVTDLDGAYQYDPQNLSTSKFKKKSKKKKHSSAFQDKYQSPFIMNARKKASERASKKIRKNKHQNQDIFMPWNDDVKTKGYFGSEPKSSRVFKCFK